MTKPCNHHILCWLVGWLVGVCVCMCVCSLHWFVCLINAAPFELNSGKNNSKMSSSQITSLVADLFDTLTHKKKDLGGGFKDLFFSPPLGEDSHFDYFFSNGWFNHQLEMVEFVKRPCCMYFWVNIVVGIFSQSVFHSSSSCLRFFLLIKRCGQQPRKNAKESPP